MTLLVCPTVLELRFYGCFFQKDFLFILVKKDLHSYSVLFQLYIKTDDIKKGKEFGQHLWLNVFPKIVGLLAVSSDRQKPEAVCGMGQTGKEIFLPQRC